MTKILLVEDDKSLREIYGVRLLAEGYDIVTAGDGEEALAMAIKERPELIVSDVMMPKISGFDMLDILRSTTETKNIKVIMMTALSSEDQRARGESLGADRYLVKSQVGIEDVVRTVHEVLGDAPVAAPVQSPPAVAPGARPAPSVPSRPDTPASPQLAPQTPAPAPVAATPAPEAPAPTPMPAPAPAPEPSNSLPQPTAPFSTNRPASLGDRIIQPITSDTPKPDIGSLIDKELMDSSPAPEATPAEPSIAIPTPEPAPEPTPEPPIAPATPEEPVAPMPMPTPTPTPAPEFEIPTPAPQAPEQQATPTPPSPQQPPMPAPIEAEPIQFEETPRPTPPTADNPQQ